MVENQVNYLKIEDIPEQGPQLFKVMMRLEFALKEIGFCRYGNGQSAEVDWDKYSNEELGAEFFEEIEASKEAEVLIGSPPKRQVVKDGNLSWSTAAAVSNVQELIGSLRRVRNNLFHGGKSGDPDRDRNDALVAGALFVVDQVLLRDDNLRMIFEGKY